jgi:predicted oxidoreductase
MSVARVSLHAEGPEFSRLVAGFWRLEEWGMGPQELLAFIHGCLDLGVTTFDHADIYGGYRCEGLFGAALALEPGLRASMQLVTKCGIMLPAAGRPTRLAHYDTGRAHIVAAVESSLRQLHTDYIDLLLIHRPDPLLDADETAAALTALREAGKVRHCGVSNFTPWQYDLLASRLAFPLVTNQVEISVLHMEALHDGTVDQCQRLRIAPMAWSPLGRGRLFTPENEQIRRVRQSLAEVGEALGGAAIDQVALAWLLAHPARIVPIVGTGKLERVRQAAAAGSLHLSREQWFEIWTASAGRPVP